MNQIPFENLSLEEQERLSKKYGSLAGTMRMTERGVNPCYGGTCGCNAYEFALRSSYTIPVLPITEEENNNDPKDVMSYPVKIIVEDRKTAETKIVTGIPIRVLPIPEYLESKVVYGKPVDGKTGPDCPTKRVSDLTKAIISVEVVEEVVTWKSIWSEGDPLKMFFENGIIISVQY